MPGVVPLRASLRRKPGLATPRAPGSFSAVLRDDARIFWEGSAARLAARVNFAGWLERFAPALFAVSTAGAVALYSLRRTAGPVGYAWLAWGTVAAIAALYLVWRERARRYGAADARVLLESALHLDAALSAAAAGVAPWPAPRAAWPAVVRWDWRAPAGWLAGAAALLALGAGAPLLHSAAAARPPAEKPPALARTEAILQELAKLDVADPRALEEFSAQARELAARPADEQYSHAALEAADALQDQTMAAVQMLAQSYDSAAAALGAPGAGDPAAERESRELAAALDGQRTGRLAANRALADAFKQHRQLSPEQRQQLRDRLNRAGSQCRGIGGAAGLEAKIAQAGDGPPGPVPGNGGINRGRADAPLTMSEQPSAETAGREQAVANDDLSHASLGDLAGTEFGGAHRVDRSKSAATASAGAVASPARGGEAAWVDRLTPADRAVVRELFK